MAVYVALSFRFPASRHYAATFSRFRRARVVAHQTLCRPDEWHHHPTSRHDETTTTAVREATDRDRWMSTLPDHMTSADMAMIDSHTHVTIAAHDTAGTCVRLATAFSDMLIMLPHLTSNVNLENLPIIDDLHSRQT